jgi:hypothetical protein
MLYFESDDGRVGTLFLCTLFFFFYNATTHQLHFSFFLKKVMLWYLNLYHATASKQYTELYVYYKN